VAQLSAYLQTLGLSTGLIINFPYPHQEPRRSRIVRSSSEANPRGTLTDQVVARLQPSVAAAFLACVRKAAKDLDLREELTRYSNQVEEQEAGEVEDPVLPYEASRRHLLIYFSVVETRYYLGITR
jgi:hypothetical protein